MYDQLLKRLYAQAGSPAPTGGTDYSRLGFPDVQGVAEREDAAKERASRIFAASAAQNYGVQLTPEQIKPGSGAAIQGLINAQQAKEAALPNVTRLYNPSWDRWFTALDRNLLKHQVGAVAAGQKPPTSTELVDLETSPQRNIMSSMGYNPYQQMWTQEQSQRIKEMEDQQRRAQSMGVQGLRRAGGGMAGMGM